MTRPPLGGLARDAARAEQARTTWAPGMVVIGYVRNQTEDTGAGAKPRPLILVGRTDDGVWRVVGLTSSATYADGRPRIPVVEPALIGLPRPGYFWGGRLPYVPPEDLERQLGWVGTKDAAVVNLLHRLRGQEARDLVAAAVRHHRRKATT